MISLIYGKAGLNESCYAIMSLYFRNLEKNSKCLNVEDFFYKKIDNFSYLTAKHYDLRQLNGITSNCIKNILQFVDHRNKSFHFTTVFSFLFSSNTASN